MFEVDITFDDFSEQIYWILEDICNDNTGLLYILSYDIGEESDRFEACIPRTLYYFEIGDFVGDGMAALGRVSVSYDESNVLDIDDTEFTDYESAEFGECGPLVDQCSGDNLMNASVVVQSDNYPGFQFWYILDSNSNLIASEDITAEEFYHQSVCLVQTCENGGGNYTFHIIDSSGRDTFDASGYYKVTVNGTRVDDGDNAMGSLEILGCPLSSSPPVLPTCPPNETMISLDIQADRYHTEISWEISDSEGNVVKHSQDVDFSLSPEKITSSWYCLKIFDDPPPEFNIEGSANYKFRIYDAGGDGLVDAGKDWERSGHFKFFVNGVQKYGESDGTDFGFQDTITFDPRAYTLPEDEKGDGGEEDESEDNIPNVSSGARMIGMSTSSTIQRSLSWWFHVGMVAVAMHQCCIIF